MEAVFECQFFLSFGPSSHVRWNSTDILHTESRWKPSSAKLFTTQFLSRQLVLWFYYWFQFY